MKYADWRYLATICTVLGVILLIGGVITYVYSETWFYLIYHPYRDYAIPLFIFGVVLLIIGVTSFGRAEEEKKSVENS